LPLSNEQSKKQKLGPEETTRWRTSLNPSLRATAPASLQVHTPPLPFLSLCPNVLPSLGQRLVHARRQLVPNQARVHHQVARHAHELVGHCFSRGILEAAAEQHASLLPARHDAPHDERANVARDRVIQRREVGAALADERRIAARLQRQQVGIARELNGVRQGSVGCNMEGGRGNEERGNCPWDRPS
jgi:hypothetical protein